jgi:hypothetical protein
VSSGSSVVESFLGDIVIARGVARRQARAAGHTERTELRILALHGLLHLLGYDHERDHGRMLRVEQRLRRKGGLREGLIERARPSAFAKATADRRGAKRGGRSTGSGRAVPSPLILSSSPLDLARGDPEALEGSKDERRAHARPARSRAPR